MNFAPIPLPIITGGHMSHCRVYLALQDLLNDDEYVHVSVGLIAEHSGYKREYIYRVLDDLTEWGILEKESIPYGKAVRNAHRFARGAWGLKKQFSKKG